MFSRYFMQLMVLSWSWGVIYSQEKSSGSATEDNYTNDEPHGLSKADSTDDVVIPFIEKPPKPLPDYRVKAAVVAGPEIREAYSPVDRETLYAESFSEELRTSLDEEPCHYTFTVPRSSHCSSVGMETRMSEMQQLLSTVQGQMHHQKRRLDAAEAFIRRFRSSRRDASVHPGHSSSTVTTQDHRGGSGAARALQDLSEGMQLQLSNLEIQIDDAESKRLKLQLRNLNLTRMLFQKQRSVLNLTEANLALNESVGRLKRELKDAMQQIETLSDNQRLLVSEKVNHEEARQILVERVGRLSLENEQLEVELFSLRNEVEKLKEQKTIDKERLENATAIIFSLNETLTSLQKSSESTNDDPEPCQDATSAGETDEQPEVEVNYTTCGLLVNVSDPQTIRQSRKPILHRIGVWMKDSLAVQGSTKVWAINQSGPKVRKLFQYPNMSAFRQHRPEDVHTLPVPMESNGAVVYNGSFYFQRRNSRRIARYKIRERKVTLYRSVKRAGFHGMFAYLWGGFTDIDFAADETGLWVIYSTAQNRGNIVVSQIDPESLRQLRIIATPIPKRKVANCFIICQVLYTVSGFKAPKASINSRFDLNTRKLSKLNVPFTNNYQFNSMIDYNPRDRHIYSWDNGRQVRYLATLDASLGNLEGGRIVRVNSTQVDST